MLNPGITVMPDGTFQIGTQTVTRSQLIEMRDKITAALEANPAAPPKVKEPPKVWRIVKLTSGRIAIITPYSDLVIDECKRRMGKWTSVSLDDASVGAWSLAFEHLEPMQKFLGAMYDAPTSLKVITFDSNGEANDAAPEIDGARLLAFSRDQRGRIAHPAIVEILEDALKSGGSARYPKLRGRLVVKARIRDDAEVYWNGGHATVTITDPE